MPKTNRKVLFGLDFLFMATSNVVLNSIIEYEDEIFKSYH